MADLSVTPAAPATPPAGDPAPAPAANPTPDAPVVDTDQDEWDNVHKELYPDLNKEDDEPDKKKPEAQNNPEDKKPDAESGAGDDTTKGGEGEGDDKDPAKPTDTARTDTSARDSRLTARRAQAEVEAIKADIRTALYPDSKETLVDGDGDPITSVDDVMKLIDPRTGEPFTEDAAGIWLLSAQQQFNRTKEAEQARIDKVADVTSDLKDQADVINEKYADLLKDENLKAKLWTMYEKTLRTENDIIVEAPTSLEEFYDFYLEPRLEASKAQEQAAADTAAQEEQARKDAEAARAKKRSDRSDVYAGGKDPVATDPDEDEWESAKSDLFGKRR